MALPAETPYPLARPATPTQHVATVASIHGTQCVINLGKTEQKAKIATHLPILSSGQRVVAIHDGDDNWLVIAAWPTEDSDTLYRFDPKTRTLHIQASRLKLSALGSIELSCGDARIKLDLDGKVNVSGAEVLSAAIGSNRIEGASIDLN